MGTAREKRICKAAASYLAHGGLFDVQDIVEPDVINRVSPDIDLEFTIAACRYFLEHTLVENAPDQTSGSNKWSRRFSPLAESLHDEIPCNVLIRVHIAHDAPIGSKRGEKERVDEVLREWLLERVPLLALGLKVGKAALEERTACDLVPFDCSLVVHGMPAEADVTGRVIFVAQWFIDRIEAIRLSIQKAIDRKCPKLLAAKLRRGGAYDDTVSVLVCETLEYSDPGVIAEELAKHLYQRSLNSNDCPDIAVVVWPYLHVLHFMRVKDQNGWLHDNPDWYDWGSEWPIGEE